MNEEKERSYILVEFQDLGSTEIIQYKHENISPLQLLTLGVFLDFEGKNALAVQRSAQIQAEMKKQQREQIVVPSTPQVKL